MNELMFFSEISTTLREIDPNNIDEEWNNWLKDVKRFMIERKLVSSSLLKVWIDDIREKPNDYTMHMRSVNEVINLLMFFEDDDDKRFLLDLDHDAGDFRIKGGDYIRILDWIEATDYLNKHPDKIIFSIHSANPVGRENMMRIIKKNDWEYI